MASTEWRSSVLERLHRLFVDPDRTHGIDHALEVENLVLGIVKEPEFMNCPLDMTVLRIAALLHDVGYAAAKSSWSSHKGEHICEGANIARDILTAMPRLSYDNQRMNQIRYLILNHDQTNYSFPIATRDGKVIDPIAQFKYDRELTAASEDRQTQIMLSILKDADARTSTGHAGADKTFSYSISRGLPAFSAGNPLNAWMWEESGVGNVRLASKRALLDASTHLGKALAWRGYEEAEGYIEVLCSRNGIPYEAELSAEDLRTTPLAPGDRSLRIVRITSWTEVVDILRRVKLHGDPSLFPYAASAIRNQVENRTVELNRLSPLSLYVLVGQLEIHAELRRCYLTKYALDPLDLSNIIEFEWKGDIYRLGPPIVERYNETHGLHRGEVWGLVDGLHRCFFARRAGLPRIRAIVINEIPDHFPLVPLPLSWEEVRGVEAVPHEVEKRSFRHASLDTFPDISWFSNVRPETDREARYFFYRDLSILVSSGIRQSPQELPLQPEEALTEDPHGE